MSDFGKTLLTSVLPVAASLISLAAILLSTRLAYLLTKSQKEKDYENDYYKKVIESRLETYKLVQDLLATLAHVSKDTSDDKCYYTLFSFTKLDYILNFNLDLDNNYKLQGEGNVPQLTKSQLNMYGYGLFVNKLATVLSRRAWLSTELVIELGNVKAIWDLIGVEINKQTAERVKSAKRSIIGLFKLKEAKIVTVPDLIVIGKSYYDELDSIVIKIRKHTYHDVSTLHEVEKFIKAKLKEDIKSIPTPYMPNLYNTPLA